MIRHFIPNVAALLLSLHAAAPMAAELPVEHFFANYQYAQMRLSPDGRRLAALAPANGHRNLFVIDLDTRDARALTNLSKQDISGYEWVSNERLVFTVDEDGNEAWGLFAVNADQSDPQVLVRPRSSQYYNLILDRLEDNPDEILVISNARVIAYPDVYRLNVHTGHKRRVVVNPGNVIRWITDQSGRVRAGVTRDGLRSGIVYGGGGDWEEVAEFDFGEGDVEPLGFSYDGRTLYVASDIDTDTRALMAFDPSTGKLGERIFVHKAVDVVGAVFSDARQTLVGVEYYTDRPRFFYFDPTWHAVQQALDQQLPNTHNVIVSHDDNDNRFVIRAYTDRSPGSYFLLDLAQKKLELLADVADHIDPQTMSETRYVTYTARDGTPIPAYLTLPNGREPRGLPLVVHPHGGPYGVRDGWGFDPTVQFLANRGYAVLQVNFRGSGGYGRRFLEAGYRQWGRSMQDDISDGLRWLTHQGTVDPDRVCIFGASYGGYATMAGLAFTPELYRCGINYVGVTDIKLLFDTVPRWWLPLIPRMKKQIGDPYGDDSDFLAAVSPLRNASKIRAPVLMAYGMKDPRVDLKHGTRMRDALEDAGVPVELIIRPDEGHGFVKERNRIELFKRIDKFLKQHLRAGTG